METKRQSRASERLWALGKPNGFKRHTGLVDRANNPGSAARQEQRKAEPDHEVHIGMAHTRAEDMRLPIPGVFAIDDECRAVVPGNGMGNLPGSSTCQIPHTCWGLRSLASFRYAVARYGVDASAF
jgi:hypothetical protein